MTKIFVTGGSGFVGGKLIERLVADGHDLLALARSEKSALKVAALGAEPVRGDLSDAASLEGAAAGCQTAYHVAAKHGATGPWEEFQRDTVDAARNVVAAAAAAGVRRLVQVSTEAVSLKRREALVDTDERAPVQPEAKERYARAKALAEQTVMGANRDGFETVAVRPRFVWGVGDVNLLPSLVALTRAGRLKWLSGGTHHTSVTHIDNLIHGLCLAAEKGRPGEAYYVTDGEPVQFREFVTELLDTQGVEAPTASVPAPIGRAVAVTGETIWRLFRRDGSPPLTPFNAWISSRDCTINITKAMSDLGYAPVRTRAEGMAGLRAEAGQRREAS